MHELEGRDTAVKRWFQILADKDVNPLSVVFFQQGDVPLSERAARILVSPKSMIPS